VTSIAREILSRAGALPDRRHTACFTPREAMALLDEPLLKRLAYGSLEGRLQPANATTTAG
jgi:hypothetical protein